MIKITEKELDDLFVSFRKNKQIIARPTLIDISKEEKNWKISLTFNSSVYLKASTYCRLKPLWNFIKQKISEQTHSNLPSTWEIIRER
jgi:hypothetical protein